MAISCPYCQHNMSVKDAKPGRYKPKCSKCGKRFSLTIPTNPADAPTIAALSEEQVVAKPVSNPNATLPATATASAPAKAIDPNATLPAAATVSTPANVPNAKPASPKVEQTVVNNNESTGVWTPPPPPAVERRVVGNDETTGVWTPPTSFSPTPPAPVNPPGLSNEATGVWDDKTRVGMEKTHAGIDATIAAPTTSQISAQSSSAVSTRAGTVAGGGTVPGDGNATRAATVVPAVSPAGSNAGCPERLGGYKILRELGRGAMGAVYLAKQISLDRKVALKTIQAQWCNNPTFVARFTREAYAAAQLTHHNVVQIYDLGCESGVNFFSMEFVNGESLADIVESKGRLSPEDAVGYVLQAARGLQFAHSHGMVHRDVKPANLMLNDHGVVKVADLGLVKTPQALDADDTPVNDSISLSKATAEMTVANVAMGTPAYMAPEQADNAAGVDHRADIYSLGCSLYVLLIGRPPFQGATAWEVMTKHRTEPIVRPDIVVRDVPPELSDIVLKMTAKKPDDRYHSLAEVITALEKFLHKTGKAVDGPTEAHAKLLDESNREFNSSSAAKLRGLVALGYAGVVVLLAVLGVFISFGVTLGLLGMLGSAVLTYFVISGVRERTYLFDKVREFIFQSRWTDWLTWCGGILMAGLIALLSGWFIVWIVCTVLGVGAGLAFYFVFDGKVKRGRQPAVDRVEEMLRSLRIAGVEESTLRDFVAKYSGDDWEELFELLFGYEAKIDARKKLAEDPSNRRKKRFRAWRDNLIDRMDSRLKTQKEARDRRHLQRIEEAGLRAQGVSASDAKKQAQQMAAAIVDEAAENRAEPVRAQASVDPAIAAAKKREKIKAMLAEARSGNYKSKRAPLSSLVTGPIGFLTGPGMRFLLGCALVAGCVMWMRQNPELAAQVKAAGNQALENQNLGQTMATVKQGAVQSTQPLNLPVVGRFFDWFNSGVAGVILIFSSFFRGSKMSIFAFPAALVALCGPALGVPGIAAIGGAHVSSIVIGLGVAAVGLLFGRSRG